MKILSHLLTDKLDTMKPAYKKGEVIRELKAKKVVPFFVDDDSRYKSLPRYRSSHKEPHQTYDSRLPVPVQNYISNLLKQTGNPEQSLAIYAVIASLHLVVRGGDYQSLLESTEEEVVRQSEMLRSWKLVQDKIQWEQWNKLMRAVMSRLFVIWVDHPLQEYASYQVPQLTDEERKQVVDILQLSNFHSESVLALMKRIQDSFIAQPYGVLLDMNERSDCPPHSCAPTAQLEITTTKDNQVSLTALYDLDVDTEITLSYIETDESVEKRERLVEQRTGHSCSCLRCRYEADPDLSLLRLSRTEAVQLGRSYMSGSHFDSAKLLYEQARPLYAENPDLWHVLGAIELSKGNFLQAQRIWNKAIEDNKTMRLQHLGLALQWDKLRAYRYLEPRSVPTTPMVSKWTSPVPQVFVTKMLDPSVCQQVIAWAGSGKWTQQRHYAVPTHDVPVHTVQPLLEWFNEWFTNEICPLLASQFGTTPNYYVHDAFCVRYEAGKASNHLPIHADESTHSFVLALNEDYEGGGTYFYDHNETVRLHAGEVLSFRGDDLQHGGEALTRGRRYILAVFLYHDDDGKGGSSGHKRTSQISKVLRDSKSQRLEFSFGFDTNEQQGT